TAPRAPGGSAAEPRSDSHGGGAARARGADRGRPALALACRGPGCPGSGLAQVRRSGAHHAGDCLPAWHSARDGHKQAGAIPCGHQARAAACHARGGSVMACAILTEDVLRVALRRQLSTDQRAVVLRHLREPCEACLDLLEGWTAEEMMPAADDLLSTMEQERILDSVARSTLPTVQPAPRLARRER